MGKTRYAVIGTGRRAFMYCEAIMDSFSDCAELRALCDTNRIRMSYVDRYLQNAYSCGAIPQYHPRDLHRMISDEHIDTVIVTSIDRTHHIYITEAMRAGCKVITEKPMTTDCAKAEEIFSTVEDSGIPLRVTFNYRYAPRNTKLKELLLQGVIGEVKSVHFEWLLDTRHGADYFRRWHRDKRNSGGLMVHKATHHFDLINWWLNSTPVEVSAMGELMFYGKANAEKRGVQQFYHRGTGTPSGDPFALDLTESERLHELYYKAEKEDGYLRDQSVFSDGISIEDDMSVLVRYQSGVMMSYHLHAYAPWEGYRVMCNGTRGRVELEVVERAYLSGDTEDPNRIDVRKKSDFQLEERESLLVRPLWDTPYEAAIPEAVSGGHGGGDEKLLSDLFRGDGADPLGRAADHCQGAASILTGIAANQSMRTGSRVKIADMLRNYPRLQKTLGYC